MPNKVIYSETFIRKAKNYKKKHLSLVDDLFSLEQELLSNPNIGNSLGSGLFKVRLAVKSKGKGKSGGFRIITYLISEEKDDTTITMLTIYDKSEESSIDREYLKRLIKELFS